jgi:hypothetical protein
MSDYKSNLTTITVVDTWNYIDSMWKNYILNRLDNKLYDMYSSIKSAKTLWEVLDKNYKAKDVGMKNLYFWILIWSIQGPW